jgi:osmotically-inducible protein OsmY
MKKIIFTTFLMVNALLLTSCLPVIQGASTIGSVVSVSNDRRSAGTILDDKTLNFKLVAWSIEDTEIKDAHLNFLIYDKTVLIAGETPTNEMRSYISKQAQLQASEIKQIFNEIKVGPNSGILSRAKDSAITIQVEALFRDQEVFHTTHVQVMTENQVIYLMGAVTKREADKAAKMAVKAKGARKVVKLFDYLKTRPAAEIERDRQREIAKQKEIERKKQQAEIDVKKSELKRQIRELDGTTGTSF